MHTIYHKQRTPTIAVTTLNRGAHQPNQRHGEDTHREEQVMSSDHVCTTRSRRTLKHWEQGLMGNGPRQTRGAPTASPWVRVIIVNFNGGVFLRSALAGLAAQTMVNFEAVIVDNASTDGSLEGLKLPDARFRIIRARSNIGFAAGANLGAQDAQTPWVAMLNPDATPEPQWLGKLREATTRYADVALFGSTQLMAEAPLILDGAGDNYSVYGLAWRGGYGTSAAYVDKDIEVFSLCAAAALYRRDVFIDVGGFAESFFCYLEDVDLCFRLRLQGQRAMLIADARVLHVGSAIAGTSTFAYYYTARNGIWLLTRCMPWQLLLLVAPLHLASQIWLILRGHHWRARIAGIKEGLRTIHTQWPARHKLQDRNRLPVLQLCRMLAWSPRALSQRRIVPLTD